VRRILLLTPVLALAAAAGAAATPAPGAPSCPAFPADNVWHADVSALPVHPRSAAWVASAGGSTKRLHPDFGPSGDPDVPYGIPYAAVPSSHAKVHVTFDYDDESDPGPYPLGDDIPVEGGAGSGGDMHTIVVDKDTCTLYETWYTQHGTSGWTAGSGAIWNLKSNALRPAGWTSADAAGLPILPGLVRLDEVRSGHVDHAIRFTIARTDRSYVWPARHQAGAANDPNLPPMGARFRLKKSYDTSKFRTDTRVVLAAMRTYGLMLADNGSDWFFQGDAQDAWPTDLLDELKSVPASAFEAVDESSLMVSAGSAQAKGTTKPKPAWTHWTAPTATTPPAPRATPPKAPRPATTGTATTATRPTPRHTPRTTRAAVRTSDPVVPEPTTTPLAADVPRAPRRTRPWLLYVLPPALLAGAAAAARRRRRSHPAPVVL
jgi:hypothetical protein